MLNGLLLIVTWFCPSGFWLAGWFFFPLFMCHIPAGYEKNLLSLTWLGYKVPSNMLLLSVLPSECGKGVSLYGLEKDKD